MHKTACLVTLVTSLTLSTDLSAQTAREICDRQARAETGYTGVKLPELSLGPLTFSFSGSLGVGVSHSTRPRIATPDGAGAYAREQFERKRAEPYENALRRCLAAQ